MPVAAVTSFVLLSMPIGLAAQTETRRSPEAEIFASARRVFVGQPFTLTWFSRNATECTASGDWNGPKATSGNQTITIEAEGKETYVLVCTGAGASAETAVRVDGETPSLSLTKTFSPNSLTIPTSEGSAYGFCDFWVAKPAGCATQTNFGYGPAKVMQVYICLSGEVSTSECSQQPAVTGPLSPEMLKDMDEKLDAYAGTGMRLLLRFTYNFGPIGPGAMDAPIDVIAKHIDQVAPIVFHHRDLVFALEAGFIGTWGEWHDSTNGNDLLAAHQVVLDKERRYFSASFPILVRDAGDLVEYTGTVVPQPGLGMHDDFYASNATDAATWVPCSSRSGFCVPSYTTEQLQAYGADVSTKTMFAGEFGQVYPVLQSCSALDQYSYTYHPQAITIHPGPIGPELQNEGCAGSFYNKVGTRIVLQNVTVIGNATPGGRLYVSATMANEGYGRVIRPRPVTLVLIQNREAVAEMEIPVRKMDLRSLASSEQPSPVTFPFEFTLPERLPAGLTSLAFVFHDPAPSLFSQPAYALPLNSVNENGNPIFYPAVGYNVVATFNINNNLDH